MYDIYFPSDPDKFIPGVLHMAEGHFAPGSNLVRPLSALVYSALTALSPC